MGPCEAIVSKLRKWFPGWDFFGLGSAGFYGGVIIVFNLNYTLIDVFVVILELCIEVQSMDLGFPLSLLNLYGPYMGREQYWNDLCSFSCLHYENLIIRGNINLTNIWEEIWGYNAREDKVVIFFVDKFENVRWVDLEQVQLGLTWSNNKSSLNGVSKRLVSSWYIRIYFLELRNSKHGRGKWDFRTTSPFFGDWKRRSEAECPIQAQTTLTGVTPQIPRLSVATKCRN